MATSLFHVGQRLTDGVNVDLQVKRVASGGFGEVAMGPNLLHEGRWSALKVLRPDLLARMGVQSGDDHDAGEARLRVSFLREALTWKGLWPHSNLLTAQFVTPINGELMLVLDYAEHGSIRDLFTATRHQGSWLPLDAALNLAQQIATGLVALHTPAPELLRDRPIVHRDLKPENILLNQYGYARITDFGLAKAVTEAARDAGSAAPPPVGYVSAVAADSAATDGMGAVDVKTAVTTIPATQIVATATQFYPTQHGLLLGTPAYMAPEQWLDASRVGPPVDAYAFGLILAELFTGRHPLLPVDQPHTLADWRQAHLGLRPVPLRQLGADVFAAQRVAHATDHAADYDVDWGIRQRAALEQMEELIARLLVKPAEERPLLDEALATLQATAQTLGEQPYIPPEEYVPVTVELRWIFWKGWADAYTHFGLYAEALVRLERARALVPENPDVLSSYANILGGLGREEEALAVEWQVLELLPADDRHHRAFRWSNIGARLRKLERYAEAEAAFTAALELAPAYADVWFGRARNAGLWALMEQEAGQAATARERVSAGLAYIEQAIRLNDESHEYHKLAQVLLILLESSRA